MGLAAFDDEIKISILFMEELRVILKEIELQMWMTQAD